MALVAVALTACAPPAAQVSPSPTATFQSVRYYPACGNELLVYGGVTYYPVTEMDFGIGMPVHGGAAVPGVAPMSREVARVAAPGPGDDVGTLVLYSDGTAYFVSDSGDLERWLSAEPRTYTWEC